ncbi:MAG: NAD(+) synthase [Leadbetterella sp.]
MALIKVAAGVLNQTALDWANNKKNIVEAIDAAKKQDIQVLCLPELCITGYGCEDQFYSPDLLATAEEILFDIAEHTSDILVCLGLPITISNKLFNAACIVANKQILGFVCKQHLPNNGLFYEDRWFHRWKPNHVTEIKLRDQSYPVGDLIFDVSGIKIGIEICEDAWVPNRPGVRNFDRGVHIILNPSASPFAFNKFSTREQIVKDASRAFSCSYIYTNLLGNETGRLIFDGDAMVCSNGDLLVSSDRFSYADVHLSTAVIDTDSNQLEQSKIKSNIDTTSKIVSSYFSFHYEDFSPVQVPKIEAFEKGGFIKEEEFARAVALGLFDYLRKSFSQGFTVSLSGGADSCACAALCALMLRLADESIGLEQVKLKLGHISKISTLTSWDEISKNLIHTLYQGTQNSSDDTFNSAKMLADDIGASFHRIDIDNLVNAYTSLIEIPLGRKLSWETDDIPLQNIQARVRNPGVWMLANIHNHLLLATSNRSEVAVGYCTMDGDTAGSISPIAGIDKNWLRTWLLWLEKTGCEVKGKNIKIPGLAGVNKLQPTAELRPKANKQTDEKDLMPYTILNQIEILAVRDKKSPLFIYKQLQNSGDISKDNAYLWVNRFFTLWSRNQWKRERYAPGFHLDSHNLDSRSWARFPILNGGFRYELQKLKDFHEGKNASTKKKIGF